ncbi:MAG: hypothetical protein AAF586_06045 [Planctomycetota bacterium]
MPDEWLLRTLLLFMLTASLATTYALVFHQDTIWRWSEQAARHIVGDQAKTTSRFSNLWVALLADAILMAAWISFELWWKQYL